MFNFDKASIGGDVHIDNNTNNNGSGGTFVNRGNNMHLNLDFTEETSGKDANEIETMTVNDILLQTMHNYPQLISKMQKV